MAALSIFQAWYFSYLYITLPMPWALFGAFYPSVLGEDEGCAADRISFLVNILEVT
jgi:hypothetical protein